MSEPRKIILGQHEGQVEVPVYEQSLSYMVNRVKRFGLSLTDLAELSDSQDAGAVVAAFGERTYDALVAVIPTLKQRMTREQFWPADDDEEAQRVAPSLKQIRAAFKAAAEESGLDIIETLWKTWVDPTMLREAVNARLAGWILTASPSSPPQSGASDPESSGTTVPASTEIAPVPSLA